MAFRFIEFSKQMSMLFVNALSDIFPRNGSQVSGLFNVLNFFGGLFSVIDILISLYSTALVLDRQIDL